MAGSSSETTFIRLDWTGAPEPGEFTKTPGRQETLGWLQSVTPALTLPASTWLAWSRSAVLFPAFLLQMFAAGCFYPPVLFWMVCCQVLWQECPFVVSYLPKHLKIEKGQKYRYISFYPSRALVTRGWTLTGPEPNSLLACKRGNLISRKRGRDFWVGDNSFWKRTEVFFFNVLKKKKKSRTSLEVSPHHLDGDSWGLFCWFGGSWKSVIAQHFCFLFKSKAYPRSLFCTVNPCHPLPPSQASCWQGAYPIYKCFNS